MHARLARLIAAFFAVALLAAACGDDATTPTDAVADDAMADDDAMAGMEHDHGDSIDVPDGMAVPTISIEIENDPVAGQNLYVDLADFEISPENASTEAVDGEGHLHLYVDGERVARFYNDALHLELDPGDHTVMVEVSANDHSAYAVDGEPIRAMASIEVPESEHEHQHNDAIEAVAPVPTIEVSVTADPISGWNLHADVTDFAITPRAAGSDPVDGEGHLHWWLNGEKQGRLYGTWAHIAALPEGDHDIAVSLSANNHADLTVDGEPIAASAAVTVTADQAADGGHDHDHDGDGDGDGGHDHGDAGDFDAAITAATADVVIEVTYADGNVEVADERYEVGRDATVAFVVSTDVDEDIHLHGFDLFASIAPGEPAEFGFVADIPGVFELEFERSGAFIAEVQVNS